MLDIVICSKNSNLMERSINIINKTLVNYEIDYHIHKFSRSSKTLDNIINVSSSKIYILDVEIGVDIAFLIRKNDFDSIIIFISSNDKSEENIFSYRIMLLDYILFNDKYNDRLSDTLNLSLNIIYRNSVFTFKYNHVTYQIPYRNITYIEKEAQIKRCIIHTFNGTYYIVNSIENIGKLLGGSFVKTHQACIINITNVYSVDFVNNIIRFNNGENVSLLSKKQKKVIKELINKKNEYCNVR